MNTAEAMKISPEEYSEAIDIAIKALISQLTVTETSINNSSERPKGEWIFNPKDAIDLMFTPPKCSNCGFESVDCGNFCSNCGADMRENDYQKHIEDLEHCMRYEPTYNPEDGSM